MDLIVLCYTLPAPVTSTVGFRHYTKGCMTSHLEHLLEKDMAWFYDFLIFLVFSG